MLGAPFQCSIFLVKGKNILHEANCAGAKYLFMQDKFYDVSWDTGDKSVQCGRKVALEMKNLFIRLKKLLIETAEPNRKTANFAKMFEKTYLLF